METSKPGNRPPAEVRDPLHDAASREATDLELRAERLLAEYLRTWGLRDPQTLATLSRRWVRSAMAHAPASGSVTETLSNRHAATPRATCGNGSTIWRTRFPCTSVRRAVAVA